MLKSVNYLNTRWNQIIYWFHDASARAGIGWLVSLSVWAYDRLHWRLSDEWQLICGIPIKEYTLRYELELARHQTQWFAEYAYDLQCQILFSNAETSDAEKQKQEKDDFASFSGGASRAESDAITKSKKRKKANK